MAEHSYWTAVYAMELCDRLQLDDKLRSRIISAALIHDAEEAITGDLPSPVKRGRSWSDVTKAALDELDIQDVPDEFEDTVIKAADLLSALVFADEEVKMGNSSFAQIRGELIWALMNLKLEVADELLRDLGFDRMEAKHFHPEMSHL